MPVSKRSFVTGMYLYVGLLSVEYGFGPPECDSAHAGLATYPEIMS